MAVHGSVLVKSHESIAMKTLSPLSKSFVLIGAVALLSSCAHRDRVVVVQSPAAPASQSQPQTVVVERDRPQPAQTNTIVVHDAPPPPRQEAPPAEPPRPDSAWAPGHWE